MHLAVCCVFGGIVLSANVIGAFGAAALFVFTPTLPPELMPAIE